MIGPKCGTHERRILILSSSGISIQNAKTPIRPDGHLPGRRLPFSSFPTCKIVRPSCPHPPGRGRDAWNLLCQFRRIHLIRDFHLFLCRGDYSMSRSGFSTSLVHIPHIKILAAPAANPSRTPHPAPRNLGYDCRAECPVQG